MSISVEVGDFSPLIF